MNGGIVEQYTEDAPAHPELAYYKKWAHHKVKTPVRITMDYIVHINCRDKLDWETTLEVDAETKALSDEKKEALSSVYSEICVAEASPTTGHTEAEKEHFSRLLGEAYVHWIEHDASTARRILQAAMEFHRERSEETSRNWYLTAAMNTASLFVILGIVTWLTKGSLHTYFGYKALYGYFAASSGAVGALFSVIARSGKLNFKASAGLPLHRLEAISRILVGAISGVVVYLALESGLLLSTLLNSGHKTELALLAALAAGTSERLATSIISKFSNTSVDLPESSTKTDKDKK
jgi:hypothetical protein